MKKLILCLSVWSLVCVTGCALFNSDKRKTYNTIATVVQSVDMAEREYMDGLLQGRIKTNGFPEIQASYSIFQISARSAIYSAKNNTNALANPALTQEAGQLLLDIQVLTVKNKK